MSNPLYALRLSQDILDRIPAVLRGGETKPVFIRNALVRELERREAILAKRPMPVETFDD